MENELPMRPEYQSAMEQLERARRTTDSGVEYWLAREVQSIFGYESWAKFTPVLDRTSTSMKANSVDPSHHIVQTDKMMGLGRGAQRRTDDFFLSRAACYLIAINGDPSKLQIAAAQAYFAVSTRTKEVSDSVAQDEKRLALREKVTSSFKTVSGVAKSAGVPNEKQAIFHDARYQGLYGMSVADVKASKGLSSKEKLFDRMGALELSANDFQMNLAAETIRSEGVRGEANAIRKNREVAQKVRNTMIESGSRAPESLPADEPIRDVAKRVKANKKTIGKADG